MKHDRWFKILNTRIGSRKRPANQLRSILGMDYDPITWRRIFSRPGVMLVLVRYEKRKKEA